MTNITSPKMITLPENSLMIPLLVLLVLATSSIMRVASTIDGRICYGVDDDLGTKCSHSEWDMKEIQERVFKTFKYDVFEHGSGSFCIPFDIKIGKKNQTITVFSYFACNYGGWSVDERACVRCRNHGIRGLREECRNSAGGVSVSENCCLRYETYNMCIDP
ncbi:hypothetical protein LINGRAHAP2_LOCUS8835 [Linum grandiflorum]